MSEVVTPASVAESPNEADTGGIEEEGYFADPGLLDEGGVSPGEATETPEQQDETPPEAEQVESPEQQEVEPTQQQIPAKDDASRFEYHQRRGDIAENELRDVKGSQTFAIAQYIQKNPEMLDVVEDGMRNGVSARKPVPERPVRPVKPADYDVSEAHDPETSSGRYRAAHDQYLEDKDVYNDVREVRAEETAQSNAEKGKLAALRSGLIRDGGLNEAEASEAMPMLFSEDSMNPVMLANLYRMMKAPSQDAISNKEKAEALLAKKNGLNSPPPLSKPKGDSPKPTTEEDDYHASMRAHAGQIDL